MPGGYKQIHKHPNAGINSLKHRPEDRFRGKDNVLINDIRRLVAKSKKFTVPKEKVTINADGSVSLEISSQEEMLLRVNNIAMSKKSSNKEAMQAIDWLMTRLYGKPKEHVEIEQREQLTQIEYRIIETRDSQIESSETTD